MYAMAWKKYLILVNVSLPPVLSGTPYFDIYKRHFLYFFSQETYFEQMMQFSFEKIMTMYHIFKDQEVLIKNELSWIRRVGNGLTCKMRRNEEHIHRHFFLLDFFGGNLHVIQSKRGVYGPYFNVQEGKYLLGL